MNTTTALTADVLVVGFGKGGKTAAHALTDAGRRVILIEQSDEMYGGTCPNVGCVPTKSSCTTRAPSGWRTTRSGVLRELHRRRPALTSAFRAGNFEALNGKDTAVHHRATARFVDAHTVAVGDGTTASRSPPRPS